MKSQAFLVLMISYQFVESWLLNAQAVFCLESPCFHELLLCLCHTNIRQGSVSRLCCAYTLWHYRCAASQCLAMGLDGPKLHHLGEVKNYEAVSSISIDAWSAWLIHWMLLLLSVKITLKCCGTGFSALKASDSKTQCRPKPTACPGKGAECYWGKGLLQSEV